MIDIDFLTNTDVSFDKNGKLLLRNNSELVKQKVVLLLKLDEGGFFYNISQGIPYSRFLSGEIKESVMAILMINALSDLSGVATIENFSIKNINRKANIIGRIMDVYGQIINIGETQ